jgi:hypothetical protein
MLPQGKAVAVGPSLSPPAIKPPPAGAMLPQGKAVAVGPSLSPPATKPPPAGAMRPQGQAPPGLGISRSPLSHHPQGVAGAVRRRSGAAMSAHVSTRQRPITCKPLIGLAK